MPDRLRFFGMPPGLALVVMCITGIVGVWLEYYAVAGVFLGAVLGFFWLGPRLGWWR
jgi:hypothetical protein